MDAVFLFTLFSAIYPKTLLAPPFLPLTPYIFTLVLSEASYTVIFEYDSGVLKKSALKPKGFLTDTIF